LLLISEMNRIGGVMADIPLDQYIDAVASALALPVEEAWRPAIRANLEVSLKLARLVDEFALPDEAEPASVFTA
jgi:hypothetical protein